MAAANPEVNARNIATLIVYTRENRLLIKELQSSIETLRNDQDSLRKDNAALKAQIGVLQIKVFSGGATSGNHD
jgi:hypothetical protein